MSSLKTISSMLAPVFTAVCLVYFLITVRMSFLAMCREATQGRLAQYPPPGWIEMFKIIWKTCRELFRGITQR